MRSHALWLVAGAWSLMVAVTFACGSSDPGEYNIEPGHGASRTGPAGAIKTTEPSGGSSGSGGSKNHSDAGSGEKKEGGSKGSTDGSSELDVATVIDAGTNVFSGTAFKGVPVTTSAATAHAMMGGPKNPGYQMACLSCHNGATKGTAEFLFAGSIYTTVDGGTGAETVEVRVVDAKGVGTSAYSDDNGNFWATGTAALDVPGQSGARDITNVQLMPSALSSGDCNSCHNGTAMGQAIMHLP
jgi:hypothetical protein